jgi:hypothetical protein
MLLLLSMVLFIQKSNTTDSNIMDIHYVIWQKIKMASAKYVLIHSKIILVEKQFHNHFWKHFVIYMY